MKILREKLKTCRAFTLAETLITILILLMVAGIVAAGMPAAAGALDDVVETSNGQLLLSTTMTALREELSTARNVNVDTVNKTITYINSMGMESELSLGNDGKGIQLRQRPGYGSVWGAPIPLVSDEAASKSRKTGEPVQYTTYSSVTGPSVTGPSADGVITFTGLAVKRMNTDNTVAAVEGNYSIRILGYINP